MNDYKELIEALRNGVKNPLFVGNGDLMAVSTDAVNAIADTIEQLVRERDTAIADLDEVIASADDINWCLYCKHREADGQCHHLCVPCSSEWGWEWRGVQE